jgi:GntR family transcriptional regulator
LQHSKINEKKDRTTDMLNPQSPIPLYRQLADQLGDDIRRGHYAPGSRIPSENQLAAVHGIGRPTARQAIDLLVRKGLLSRRRGAGTFVQEAQQEVNLFSLDGTSASFRQKGLTVKSEILTPVQLRAVSKVDDNPFKGTSAYFLSRLTRVDGSPVLIEDIYLNATLFEGIDAMDLQGRSLSTIAEKQFFLRPTGGKQSFGIDYLKDKRGSLLKVLPQTPVLAVRRYLHFPQMANGVYARLWCRTDQFVFSQNIGGTDYA